MVTITNIEQKIEELRQKMISIGLLYGLTNPITVQISQELDNLLNIVQDKPTLPS